MNWSLPTKIKINEKEYPIRNKCDYRVVLDVISALNDEELEMKHRIECALCIFYGKSNENVKEVLETLNDIETATIEMLKIINLGEKNEEEQPKAKLMDWEHDFPQLAPPISRILGYSVRNEENYTHWYDFVGAYMEIGECAFSTVVSIRKKRLKGAKLEKWEQEFYKENKKTIDLPQNLTEEEKEWLDSDW